MPAKLFILFISLFFVSCESEHEKCMRDYIDKENYSYDEAKEQCDLEEDARIESRARR